MILHTRWLMGLSAAFMFALALGATFGPDEFLAHVGAPDKTGLKLVVQAVGALYLGFSMLNWAARGNLIGGIYSRPVAIGNTVHFTVMALALVRAVAGGTDPPMLLVVTAVYALFALWFGWVLVSAPATVADR